MSKIKSNMELIEVKTLDCIKKNDCLIVSGLDMENFQDYKGTVTLEINND